MPVSTGLVSITPWSSQEWVAVKPTPKPDVYSVLRDNKELFEVRAKDHSELLDRMAKAWRKKFPAGC
jgi:hypothetical protein